MRSLLFCLLKCNIAYTIINVKASLNWFRFFRFYLTKIKKQLQQYFTPGERKTLINFPANSLKVNYSYLKETC